MMKNVLKRVLCALFSAAILLSLFAGCAKTPAESQQEQPAAAGQTDEPQDQTDESPEQTNDGTQESGTTDQPDEQQPEESNPNIPTSAEVITMTPQDIMAAGCVNNFAKTVEGYPVDLNLPLADETATLTAWMGWGGYFSAAIDTPNDSTAMKTVEDLTNVHVEWTLSNDAATQFPLLLASGDFTDIYMSSGDISKLPNYADEEIIADLTDYIAADAPNYTALCKDDPDVARRSKTDDSRQLVMFGILTVPSVTWLAHVSRADWLNGADPVTYDDYYEVLKTFRDDEACPAPLNIAINGQDTFFMAGYDVGTSWINLDGTVEHSITQPGYRDYIQTMRTWYAEKLIDPNFYGRTNGVSFDYALTASGEIGMWSLPYQFFALVETFAEDPDFELVGVRPPVRQEGDVRKIQLSSATTRIMSNYGAVFSTCSDIALAVRYFDFWFTPQGAMLAAYGNEGEGFYYDENGIPQVTEAILHPADPGITSNMARNALIADFFPNLMDWTRDMKAGMSKNALNATSIWDYNWVDSISMPTLTLTAEESEEYSRIMSDVETRINESIPKFITGELSMDTWDAFVEELIAMGLPEAQQIEQAAFDRFMAR